jgi:hypothetical protein
MNTKKAVFILICWVIFLGACKNEPDLPMVIGRGSYPDLAVDNRGNVHVVYGRNDSLFYRKLDVRRWKWSDETSPANILIEKIGQHGIERSDPDIVIDNDNMPHVFAGSEYAYFDKQNKKWTKVRPRDKPMRDTELAVDNFGNALLVHRGGNNTGEMGILMLPKGATCWVPLTDPDTYTGSRNDHVYPDMDVSPIDNTIWVVQRHGLAKRITAHFSNDQGKTWQSEPISDQGQESPHIVIDDGNNVYVTTGSGHFFKRVSTNQWSDEGRVVESGSRKQPEITADRSNSIYCTSWGGLYNIRTNGKWEGQRRLNSLTGSPIGFFKAAGGKDYAYAVWEEGDTVNPDSGAGSVDIVFGLIKSE